MKEVKINKEIKEIKERIIFSLSLRQLVFSAIAIVISVGVYFLLRDYLDIEYLSWVIMITASPFAIMGFVTYQGMPAEKMIIELIQSYVVNKKVIENKPRNTYKLMIDVMDEESDAGQTKRKKRVVNRSILIISIILIISGTVVILMSYQTKLQLQNYISDTISSFEETYNSERYRFEEWNSVKLILNEMKSEMKKQTDKDSAEKCRDIYNKKLSEIKTYAQRSAESFENYYGNNTTIVSLPNLLKVYEEELEKIKNTTNKQDTDQAYEDAVERINEELRSFSYFL